MAVFCISAFAEPVSESEARKTALSLLKSELSSNRLKSGNKLKSENLTLIKVKKDGNTPLYYVYNAEDDGFVIVSGVEETEPILAYGLEKGIDMDNMSDATKALLHSYAAALKKIAANPSKYKTATKSETREKIEPMVSSQWGQNDPYNRLTKFKKYSSEDSVVCATGCGATATAMMMKYYYDKKGWFKGSKSIPGFISYPIHPGGDTLIVDSLPEVTFDWEHCDSVYDSSSDEISISAVAQVMRYCGQMCGMIYGKGASSAYNAFVEQGTNTYFVGDDNFSAVNFMQNMYSDETWWNLVYHELSNKRPVHMTGGGAGGGHFFICDGYEQRDNGDYYHFNWGWYGAGNGYYRYDSIFAKVEPGDMWEADLNNFKGFITYLTPDEKTEIENMGITIYDYDVDDWPIFKCDSMVEKTLKLPIQYAENKDNNIKISVRIMYGGADNLVAAPHVKITNLSTKESMLFDASDNTGYIINDSMMLDYFINLPMLKKEMTENKLGTDGVYEMLLKLNGDETEDDYLSPRYFSYMFKYSDDADTMEIITPIIVDTLILSDQGISKMQALFTVAPEIQGEGFYLGTIIVYDSLSSDTKVSQQEQYVDATDKEGAIITKDAPDEINETLGGRHLYRVFLYNGIEIYSTYLTLMGTTTAITHKGNTLADEQKNPKNVFKDTENCYIYDNLQGSVYMDEKEEWVFDTAYTRYSKAIMKANDDNQRFASYSNTRYLPLTSAILDMEVTSYYNSLIAEGKSNDEAMSLIQDSTWTDSVEFEFRASEILDEIKVIDEKEGIHNLYRLVTTVDTAGYMMPQYEFYHANYFKANDDYSELIFFSPVEVPEDGPQIVINESKVSITLRPIKELYNTHATVLLNIYSDAEHTDLLWRGGGSFTPITEETVYLKCLQSNGTFVDGNRYYYVITNHDGIIIDENNFDYTGINEINAETDNSSGSTSAKYNGKKYNLAGQEVDSNYKGIVILNGAKHVQN